MHMLLHMVRNDESSMTAARNDCRLIQEGYVDHVVVSQFIFSGTPEVLVLHGVPVHSIDEICDGQKLSRR